VEKIKIKQCPLNENYLFKTRCRINTCKFFSPTTVNRCLGMDIVFSAEDKPISDAELLYYKFHDREMTVKDVARLRKKAVDRVKGLIILHRLIHTISEKCNADQGMQYLPGRSKTVDRVLSSEPLSYPMLNFQPWMLGYLFDDQFITANVGNKFKLKEALKLKTKDFSAFAKDVKIMCSGNTLFNHVV